MNKKQTNKESKAELTPSAKELIKTISESNPKESKELQTISKTITTSKSQENKAIREKKFKDIIELIERKGESLTKATKKIGLDKKSFLLMVEKDSTLLHQYTRATEARADLIAERMVRNSHNRANDFYTDSDGNLKPNPVAVQRDRLILDTDKWLLSKLMPKKYGDRLTLDGEVKTGQPLTIENINMILNEIKE
jgi:molybdenum-dependent DNA-binding transcriptional regulator ModE